ncbi:geranylgeranyl pyrophosphate synthase [Mycobacterium sp. 852002-40037_SCH5390672]|nr:geranylgeranyl pyrophosphate synthase [Mycobacterium sp. 852002-40037_SCH5390672]
MVAGVEFDDPVVALNVHDGVARIEDLIEGELTNGDVLLRDAVLHLFRAGGKRFRPLFTVLSAQLGPDPDAWQVTTAGAVIELVHLATLHHDDVMDEARMRRTVPTVNTLWGNRIAILAGDYLFATASRLVARLGPEAVTIIADTFAQLVTGQIRETRGTADRINDIEYYLKVVHEKTACLIAAAGRFGATFSGAGHDQVERLERLGGLIGTAFQITDDIIDIDSDPETSGKLVGTDLREGVHTLPVLYALQEEGPAAERLRNLLATPVDSDDKLAECLALLRLSDGIRRAKDMVAQYATRAEEELAALPECAGRAALATVLKFAIDRHG